MRISDWSSDVCSSDLQMGQLHQRRIRIVQLEVRLAGGEEEKADIDDERSRHDGPEGGVAEDRLGELDGIVGSSQRDQQAGDAEARAQEADEPGPVRAGTRHALHAQLHRLQMDAVRWDAHTYT